MSAPLYYPHYSSYLPDSPSWRHRSHHLRPDDTRDPDTSHDKSSTSRKHDGRHKRHKHHRSGHKRIRSTTRDRVQIGATAAGSSFNNEWSPPTEASYRDERYMNAGEMEARLTHMHRREDVTMEDVKAQREERHRQEQSNRNALSSLATLSTDITRRLDDTYYNLLEKISNLHSAIYSFRDLTLLTFNLHQDLQRETTTLERDTRKQITDINSFHPQLQRIEELETRMRAGADRAHVLKRRLETVEEKIDAWDRKESEWQTGVSRLLRWIWAVVLAVTVVVLVALAVEKIRPSSLVGDAGLSGVEPATDEKEVNMSSFTENGAECASQRRLESLESSFSSDWMSERIGNMCSSTSSSSVEQTTPILFPGALEEPIQRVIDEL